jgi:glycosyltransferase involved in cell wall biosynthesis
MKISFDSQIFVAQRFGGISRYFSSLALELAAEPRVEVRLDAWLHMNDHLQGLEKRLRCGRHVGFSRARRPALYALNAGASVWRSLMSPADVVHHTYYYRQPIARRPAKVVLSVFDMIHEKFGDSYAAADLKRVVSAKRRAAHAADLVICISNSTRNDLLAAHELDPARVHVTHLGYDPLPVTDAEGEPKRGSPSESRPYLLYVGARTRYKNFLRLLEAYAASTPMRAEFELLCFGGGPWSQDESEAIRRLGVEGRVHQRAGSDRELAAAYRHATMFVYPSLYEGFGIPPLEAMSVGCPVACSNVSSIPEVVAHAGAYFDPLEVDSIRKCLEDCLASKEKRDSLVKAGESRCRDFSWSRCASETLALYERN